MRVSRRKVVGGAAAIGVGLLAGCAPLPWQHQPAKRPRIGLLTVASSALNGDGEAFRQGLGDLGYIEGQNISIEERSTEGRDDRFPALASELAALQMDVIVALSTPATVAARDAARTTPIVMIVNGDPVNTGLVASFARPGGNITGLTTDVSELLIDKRLELLRDAVPGLSRVAVITPVGSEFAWATLGRTRAAAQALGLQIESVDWEQPQALAQAVERAAENGAEALFVLPVPIGPSGSAKVIPAQAAQHRLPAMYPFRSYVDNGGLMFYGPTTARLLRRAAYYVDRILKGTSPADLPVEQPMTFDFVVNLNTAQALGITFPNEIMLQVTEVVQ